MDKESRKVVLQWIERLLDPGTEETILIAAAQVLSQNDYVDVVDERTISHVCGYPLCSNSLDEQLKQKYHISLSQKKVFDLTERKKFCSSVCYKASKYFVSQLPNVSYSAREGKSVSVQLLESAPRTELISLNKRADFGSHSVEKSSVFHIKENPPSKSDESLLDKISEGGVIEGVPTEPPLSPPKLSSVGHLLHAMSSWCTPDTWHLLQRTAGKVTMTPQTVSDMAEKNSQGAIGNAAIPQASDTAEGNSQGATGNVATLQTASDMAEEIKSTLSDKEWKKVSEKKHQCESQDEEINKILPPVHSSSQSQLQTTIFLQQLKRSLPGVASKLNFDTHELFLLITPLVKTFRFSRHTLTFKPAEWKIIIIILLQCLHPEQSLLTLHHATVQEWTDAVKASSNDLALMLNIFKPPH